MGLEVIHALTQAAHVGQRELGTVSCPTSESRFEILRATVWSMAAPRGRVHVNRVVGAALFTWRLVAECPGASQEKLREELRKGLLALEQSGDLIELKGGFWAPGTARLVQLPDRAGYLLIGGVPSRFLIGEGSSEACPVFKKR